MSEQHAKAKPVLDIFLLAGEASGDIIGADLIKKLRSKVALNLSGVGGKNMAENGLQSLFPITELSVMGLVDVVKTLPLLLRRVHQVVLSIMEIKPDIVVLIDSQVFSNLVAKGLKKRGFMQPILLYVCPTVWGYRPQRARHIKAYYDEVLAILPFEPAVMNKLNGPPCRYVGHPALSGAIEPLTEDGEKNNIILMPGSRQGELRRHLPMLKSVVTGMVKFHPELRYTILTLPHLVETLKTATNDWPVPVDICSERARRPQIYQTTQLALVVAGTATLELAAANVPMVVSYVMDIGQRLMRKFIKIKHFALPNLVLDETTVPELLFEKPDASTLLTAVLELLDNPERLKKQQVGFTKLRKDMNNGTEAFPLVDPAKCVLSHVDI